MKHSELVLVLDFGSQYTQLIARRIRELGVYSEIHPFNIPLDKIQSLQPSGIILSGGPSSVYEEGAPLSSPQILELGIPVLGICYGLQVIAEQQGGKVDPFARREFGKATLRVDRSEDLLQGLDGSTQVWMSHGDSLSTMPEGFEPIAHTDNAPICAIRNPAKKIFGVQFHPEVAHTPQGKIVLSNFLFRICGLKGDWTPEHFIQKSIEEIRSRVGTSRVLCALSGGVDSSVAAVLLHQAIGDQLHCIHINNGLMRKGESEHVVETFLQSYRFQLTYIDATDVFLTKLAGVSDPEKKRRIIGNTFIEVFEAEAKKITGAAGSFEYLAQGTL
jgi:GMP synthase (glutamine-hydrolysing)